MKRFASFAESADRRAEVKSNTFDVYKERMEAAARTNAKNRRNAIQSISKVIFR